MSPRPSRRWAPGLLNDEPLSDHFLAAVVPKERLSRLQKPLTTARSKRRKSHDCRGYASVHARSVAELGARSCCSGQWLPFKIGLAASTAGVWLAAARATLVGVAAFRDCWPRSGARVPGGARLADTCRRSALPANIVFAFATPA